MVFSSYLFLFYFLPLTWLPVLGLAWWRQRRPTARVPWARVQNAWLLVASYVFYAWAEPKFLGIMLAITVIAYAAGLILTRRPPGTRGHRAALAVAVAACLAILGFFKYWDFAMSNLDALSRALGGPAFASWGIVLPVGISFYTFQAISYCVDVSRRDAPPARSLVDFACYIALFPQLVAGPIVRYGTIAQQLVERVVSAGMLASGVRLFSLGLAKKVLLANPTGEIADAAFMAETLSCAAAWWGAVAYTLQLYFDFSAYSDMAVGLGRLFGFEFPKNFHTPYRAVSITDFWRRWHISLSAFLRDYLYVPLGGNRRGPARTYVNLLVVMLLGGLWHGANWTFLAWGAWHGVWLAFERWRGKQSALARLPEAFRVAFTLLLVLFGWVLFRAENLAAAGAYFAAMFGGGSGTDPLLAALLYGGMKPALLTVAAALALQPVEADEWSVRPGWGRDALALLLFAAAVLVMFAQSFSPFLYFQF